MRVFTSLFLFLLILSFSFPVQASAPTPQSSNTNVSARVGQYYLNLSGIVAPYASLSIIVDNTTLTSTVADSTGKFSFSKIPITAGLTGFCLDAVDFKRLGESYTCFTIPAANSDITINNIFLPPTLGLERKEINQGEDAVIWGYGVPGAAITIHISNGKTFQVMADAQGYYQLHVKIAKAGKYELYADETYQNQSSKIPDRKTLLLALSLTQQAGNKAGQAAKNIYQVLSGFPWTALFIIIPLFILIIIWLKRLKPEWFLIPVWKKKRKRNDVRKM